MHGRFRAAPTKHYLREAKKLPAQAKERLIAAVEELIVNPYLGVRLRGELQGLLRLRVGDYRIMYAVEETRKLIVLVDVGPRRSIYD
jgi:mRNA interferase RelE/StbE